MATVYCDNALASGLNDGTSWANAWQSLGTALNGSNVAAGDVLYVKGVEDLGAVLQTYTISGSTYDNPAIILGCKSATTNEPPVQSDLIPGWRTGDARTAANLAGADTDIPTITVTGAGDIIFDCSAYIYALKWVVGDNCLINAAASDLHFLCLEECATDIGDDLYMSSDEGGCRTVLLNHTFVNHDRLFASPVLEIIGGVLSNNNLSGFLGAPAGVDISGVDLSVCTVLVDLATFAQGRHDTVFRNCKLNASYAAVSGSITSPYRIVVSQSSSATGITTGASVRDLDIDDAAGTIVEETTAVRTGGATDGGSGVWSMAFTPRANATRDQYRGLAGPWMYAEVAGDGTSKTLTVFIANSGAADYNNDDVWLEVEHPSEGGTTQFDNKTTQMSLLGTPSAVTDDTTSTWGTGGNNPQKLQASIAPDYTGLLRCRAVFAKNFAASPETLYVDPLPTVA